MIPTKAHHTILRNKIQEGWTLEQIKEIPYFKDIPDYSFEEMLKELKDGLDGEEKLKEIISSPEPQESNSKGNRTQFKHFRMTEAEVKRLQSFINFIGRSSVEGKGINYLKGRGKISQVIRLAIEEYIKKYSNL
jgi:hypothetical protein